MENLQRLLFLSLFILISGASIYAQSDGPGPTRNIDLPDVDGWEKGAANHYPQRDLGYSVAYRSRIGGTVTVFVYDKGLKSIPNGIDAKLFADEIEQAESEIMRVVELGYYEKAELLKSDSITLGGSGGSVDALRRVIKLTARGRDLTSEIYLFGYQNNFIKFRATRAEEIVGLQNKAVTDLFMALDRMISQDTGMKHNAKGLAAITKTSRNLEKALRF